VQRDAEIELKMEGREELELRMESIAEREGSVGVKRAGDKS
jgi:hypothetical protein